jgi:hypothetical protein
VAKRLSVASTTSFLPLNALLLRACTDWQLKRAVGDRLVPNDHSDPQVGCRRPAGTHGYRP